MWQSNELFMGNVALRHAHLALISDNEKGFWWDAVLLANIYLRLCCWLLGSQSTIHLVLS